jgi:octanoyl-[GcvH]:protein N-octanoyltransferase
MVTPNIGINFPLLRFDQQWQLLTFSGCGDVTRPATFDERVLDQVVKGERGPSLCINRASQGLVATVRESRMPTFAASCRALAACGWPVIVRCTGGSCVPQSPGVINFSVVHRKIRGWTLEDGYKLLCDFMGHFLASYGIAATTGEVPGSFCDGRYNLQVDGRKLLGTAQRWAGGNREQAAVLAHACLLVDMDLVEPTEKINTLYRLCGNPLQFKTTSCTTLRDCLGGSNLQSSVEFVADVELRLTNMARDYFNISSKELGPTSSQ